MAKNPNFIMVEKRRAGFTGVYREPVRADWVAEPLDTYRGITTRRGGHGRTLPRFVQSRQGESVLDSVLMFVGFGLPIVTLLVAAILLYLL